MRINKITSIHIIKDYIDYKIDKNSYQICIKKNSTNYIYTYSNGNFSHNTIATNVSECPMSQTCQKPLEANNLKTSNYNLRHLYERIGKARNRVLYYTGAGISRRSGIMTMPELEYKLKINDIEGLIETLNMYPDYPLKIISGFYNSIKMARPNIDHYILRNIINKYGGDLITENFDILHELSGIRPIKPLIGDDLLHVEYDVVVIIGACSLQCSELLRRLHNNVSSINLVSYRPLLNNEIKYNFYNMDIHDFLSELSNYLENKAIGRSD